MYEKGENVMGKLFVIEGTDSSGKQTQLEKIKKIDLKKRISNIKVLVFQIMKAIVLNL